MTLSSNPSVSSTLADDQATFQLSCTLNGKPVEATVHPLSTLLEVVREDLRYTGTKGACHEGECGSCTVLVDGVPMNSCLILAPQAQGTEIVTVEGLADGETLDRVQEAFLACGAVQCGYCTPGLVISAKALLERIPDPTPEDVRNGMEGNICRCTGYVKVVDAVVQAAKARTGGCHAE